MMKKFYLLFVAAALAACSAEPVENELSGLDANLSGKSNNKATSQDVGESFDVPELICAGEETEYCLTFPQDYAGPNAKTTNVQVQLEVAPDEWVPIHQDKANTESCFSYTFEEEKSYNLRYFIGGGGHTDITISVQDCEVECASGYMIGDKDFSEIGTSANWGWAHQFNFTQNGEETREIHHKNGTLGGEVTISYENGNVTVSEGEGVTISHMYLSDVEPTETNAPGQFDKTQEFEDEDGSFWVIIKAEVCE